MEIYKHNDKLQRKVDAANSKSLLQLTLTGHKVREVPHHFAGQVTFAQIVKHVVMFAQEVNLVIFGEHLRRCLLQKRT